MEKGVCNGCIMILGAPNDKDGSLSMIAKSRLKQGMKELSLNPGFKILLTGGFGKHFNETSRPHWNYAKDFLIEELSISPDSFLPDAIESSNTIEDIEKAKPIFQKYNFIKIILVTSEFHLKRVLYLAEKVLDMSKETLFYSYVPDKELDEKLLKKLYQHEKRAIDYLKVNYRRTY
jgi:hypothetical protein